MGGDLKLAATPLQARFYRGFGRYKGSDVADVCRYTLGAWYSLQWRYRCATAATQHIVDSGAAEVRLPIVDSQETPEPQTTPSPG